MTQKHFYGSQVHLVKNSFLSGALAKLCQESTVQPEINRIVRLLYTHLISVVMNEQFPTETVEVLTRMSPLHPECLLKTERIEPTQKAVCVNLARAGTFPSHICYEFLHEALQPQNIRQDHIFAARQTNQSDQVIGTELGGAKIGGDVKSSIVILPDPMGATGNTMISAIKYYQKHIEGPARKYIALNLIVTPEYLKNLTQALPDVQIYALRLDRGLSPKPILNSTLGEFWDQEKGLNDKHYIVPGGGGFGEIMNNSFV